jgi:hypothetical protein
VAREEETSVDPSSDEGVCTVVFRRSHKVKHVALDDPEGHAIELAEKGRPFAEVCESFGNVSVGEIAGRIGSWIDRGWIERLEEGST